jgi:hypothetical protein
MKAIGKGIDMDFNAMDVCGDTHSYNGKIYFFYPIPILPGYAAHIASSVPIDIQCVAIEELPCGPI